MKKLILATAIAIAATSCASMPTAQEQASADYGPPMLTADCLSVAQAHIASLMKDPASAQFRNEPPCERGFASKVPILGQQAAYGYLQRGEVNAKNSFGGYVGFKPYFVLMYGGRVIRSCITDDNGICTPVSR